MSKFDELYMRDVYPAIRDFSIEICGEFLEDRDYLHRNCKRRFELAVSAIEEIAKQKPVVRIANVSGMNLGEPDPFWLTYLEKVTKAAFDWTVFDHPESGTATNPTVQKLLAQMNIKFSSSDFGNHRLDYKPGEYDVVICTEIAEHLNYSDFIWLLETARDMLGPNGVIILSTPNASYLYHRLLILCGFYDHLFHGDGPEDVKSGLIGHLNYFDERRLERILGLTGYRAINVSSFNEVHGSAENKRFVYRMIIRTIRLFTHLVPRSKAIVFATARK
jgi:hypothetical protein